MNNNNNYNHNGMFFSLPLKAMQCSWGRADSETTPSALSTCRRVPDPLEQASGAHRLHLYGTFFNEQSAEALGSI